MEEELLLLARWEATRIQPPGPRAIERPTPTVLPAQIRMLERFLRHHFRNSVATIRRPTVAFPVTQDSPAIEKRTQFARVSARRCALRLAAIRKTHNHDQ